MTSGEIRTLREELGLSIGGLAERLRVDVRTVIAWEEGDLFPTKRHSTLMEKLRGNVQTTATQSARNSREPSGQRGPPAADADGSRASFPDLRDPALWEIVEAVVTDPELKRQVLTLVRRWRP